MSKKQQSPLSVTFRSCPLLTFLACCSLHSWIVSSAFLPSWLLAKTRPHIMATVRQRSSIFFPSSRFHVGLFPVVHCMPYTHSGLSLLSLALSCDVFSLSTRILTATTVLDCLELVFQSFQSFEPVAVCTTCSESICCRGGPAEANLQRRTCRGRPTSISSRRPYTNSSYFVCSHLGAVI